jgi:hypothetical protein
LSIPEASTTMFNPNIEQTALIKEWKKNQKKNKKFVKLD